jgi:hypothetical protein
MTVKIPIVKKRTAKFKFVSLRKLLCLIIHQGFCVPDGTNPTGITASRRHGESPRVSITEFVVDSKDRHQCRR